jgi:hypothetical protein
MRRLALVVALLGFVAPAGADDGPFNLITIIGQNADLGDGGPAADASLAAPSHVLVIPSTSTDPTLPGGDLIIVDQQDHRLRRVDARGVISTFAGTGLAGFNGDTDLSTGHPTATEAHLQNPAAAAARVEADGTVSVFIADRLNLRIRKVNSGIITTVAGTGVRTPPDQSNIGNDGPAVAATFNGPLGITVDPSGDVVVADEANHQIRRIYEDQTPGSPTLGQLLITRIAGTGVLGSSGDTGPATSANINAPADVVFDGLGNFYVAERGGNRIRRVDAAGIITTLAGTGGSGASGDGGLATAATLNPARCALDPVPNADGSRNLIVADQANNRVRKVYKDQVAGSPTFGQYLIARIGGTDGPGFSGDGGPATAARFSNIPGVAVDSAGNVFVADRDNDRVRRIDPSGTVTTVAGRDNPEGGPADALVLKRALGMAKDTAGNLYVAAFSSHRIWRIDAEGNATSFAGIGSGGFSGDGGLATAAQLSSPGAIIFDGAGNALIADAMNGRVRKIGSGGTITTFASGLGGLSQFAFDKAGNLFVAGVGAQRVWRLDPAGGKTSVAGTGAAAGLGGPSADTGDGGAATLARLLGPGGLAFDEAGALYVAESGEGQFGGQRVRKIVPEPSPDPAPDPTASGLITGAPDERISNFAGTSATVGFSGDGGPATSATFNQPRSVVVMGSSVIVSDGNNNRLRKVDRTTGVITTFCGDGIAGFGGEGGPAAVAEVANPNFLFLDAAGNLYLSQCGQVRLFTLAAKTLSVDRNAGGVTARVELYDARLASDLSNVTLRTIDPATRFQAFETFPGTDLGPDPADPTNVHKRVFGFGLQAALLAGEAFRFQALFASDGKSLSQDAPFSITWSDPADITYGTALSGTQLDATASVPGTFTYAPATGTVLHAGAGEALTAHFVPSDPSLGTADWTAQINVLEAPLTITPDDKTKILGAPNPTLTFTASGFVNGDTAASLSTQPTLGTSATTTSPVGEYGIAASGAASPDYTISYGSGTLRIAYAVCLLYDPTKMVNSGATVPIRLYLGDINSADVSSPAVVLHATAVTLADTNTSGVLAAAGDANPDLDFRFDPTLAPSGGYIFNLKTTGLGTGTWMLSFSASGDPAMHAVSFQVR